MNDHHTIAVVGGQPYIPRVEHVGINLWINSDRDDILIKVELDSVQVGFGTTHKGLILGVSSTIRKAKHRKAANKTEKLKESRSFFFLNVDVVSNDDEDVQA